MFCKLIRQFKKNILKPLGYTTIDTEVYYKSELNLNLT